MCSPAKQLKGNVETKRQLKAARCPASSLHIQRPTVIPEKATPADSGQSSPQLPCFCIPQPVTQRFQDTLDNIRDLQPLNVAPWSVEHIKFEGLGNAGYSKDSLCSRSQDPEGTDIITAPYLLHHWGPRGIRSSSVHCCPEIPALASIRIALDSPLLSTPSMPCKPSHSFRSSPPPELLCHLNSF